MQPIPSKPHVIDNMEDEQSVVSHSRQIISSKESVRVGNIATLKVNNLPSNQLNVDSKISPSYDHSNNHDTAPVDSTTLSGNDHINDHVDSKVLPGNDHNDSHDTPPVDSKLLPGYDQTNDHDIALLDSKTSPGCDQTDDHNIALVDSKTYRDYDQTDNHDIALLNSKTFPGCDQTSNDAAPPVDSKIPGSDHHSVDHDTAPLVINNNTHTISPDSCEDNQNKLQDEPDKSIPSDDECEENTVRAKSQQSPVTTYTATEEDMKIIAAACYEYVMDLLENWDSAPLIEDDNEPCEEDKVVYYLDDYLDPKPLTEKASNLPAEDANNEDMQCLAMACYETVMEMIRNGDIHSSDTEEDTDGDKPVYYLDVEPSDNYELPLYACTPSVSANDTQQHSNLEKKTEKKAAHAEVLSHKTTSQRPHSQPLVTEDTTVQHCINSNSVDSLVPCSEQTDNDQVEEVIKNGEAAGPPSIDHNCNNKSEETSSSNLCK